MWDHFASSIRFAADVERPFTQLGFEPGFGAAGSHVAFEGSAASFASGYAAADTQALSQAAQLPEGSSAWLHCGLAQCGPSKGRLD